MVNQLTKHADAPNQTLPEYQIGAAFQTCTFPGIAQCFAVIGLADAKIVCAHISPGSTRAQMKDIFTTLNAKGGDAASIWYVIGPCDNHYGVGRKTIWNSNKDVLRTFRRSFGKKVPIYLLDVTAERNVHRPDPQIVNATFPIHGIDIRVVKNGISLSFSYREQLSLIRYGDWQPLPIARFSTL